MAKNLLIVESPTKVKTIKKYLGKDYDILASYGHVRDLESKSGSVEPDHGFKMIWKMTSKGAKQVKEIADRCKEVDNVYLATDPDREGEAISWHIQEILKSKKIKCNLRRITFFEITERAIKEALQHARDINQDLVSAYLGRRALDYLFGFTLSPLLWRKLPGAKSAGRVQSVALRLIAERDDEIAAFIPEEYWSIYLLFGKFNARLTVFDEKKLDKLAIKNQEQAEDIKAVLDQSDFHVAKIDKKSVKRQPAPPFMTSTLQQAASSKLGFSAKKTMTTAQTLYEGVQIGKETQGLITYMRTDSFMLSQDALTAIRQYIGQNYSAEFLPSSPRVYKKKVRNAQEAHEAIRPIDVNLTPDSLRNDLTPEQYKLYKLIWERAVASQLADALFDRVTVTVASQDKKHEGTATGTTCTFKGFLAVYGDDEDDKKEEEGSQKLPPVKEGEALAKKGVDLNQHFTQPPYRYTEASLVKKLEELGIGRPSTYASLIETLKDRQYVRLESKHFVTEARGKVVTYFLEEFFNKYVEYDFTAQLEEKLDEVSSGKIEYLDLLKEFWEPFVAKVKETGSLKVSEVIDHLETKMNTEKKMCPLCHEGTLNLKLSKFGAFLGCSRYPECKYAVPLDSDTPQEGEEGAPAVDAQKRLLGEDPETKNEVWLKKGPYGFYIQVGEKKSAVPAAMNPQAISLEQGIMLGKLPLTIGEHEGKTVQVGMSRFGPYVKYDSVFASIPKSKSLFELTMEEAMELVAKKQAKGSSPARKKK